MIVGIDFDNTLVQYDGLLHQCALERSLIPNSIPSQKTAVRDHIQRAHGNDAWTELQGFVYGERIDEAPPSPGARSFVARARACGATVFVVSHKTQFPALGPRTDLHNAARCWLRAHGFIDQEAGLPSLDSAFFETTRAAKLARIGTLGCTLFIDDLPECLEDPAFPRHTQGILFDPSQVFGEWQRTPRIASFSEAGGFLQAMTSKARGA